MERHLIGRFNTHDEAEQAMLTLEKQFPQQVSISTTTPHEQWWRQGTWLETSLQAIGGIVASVSAIVPGFGVLFMGGPLDGAAQGTLLAEWLESHPNHQREDGSCFLIITVSHDDLARAEQALVQVGATDVHVSTD